MIPILPGVFMDETKKGKRFYTKNLLPGKVVYGERLLRNPAGELREWDVFRSKLGAALAKGLKELGCNENNYVLYLGCASGTTVSHLSDIVGKKGVIFAVDISPRSLRDMVFLAQERKNIAPILADANHTETLSQKIVGVDLLVQDIAQRDQVRIFLKNFVLVKKGGLGLLSVKARSIKVGVAPKVVFAQVRKDLEAQVDVLQAIALDPFEKDHMLFVCRMR